MTGVDAVDEADPGTWTWLLKDAHGSVAIHVKADGTVTKQASYDPYGAPDQGGTSGASKSTLGFQSAHTDETTGNLLLGSRLYDPKVDRFTTSDFFVGSGSDLSLATDPLTGNRYLFAAANPVAFYDDGHAPACGTNGQVCKSYTTRKAVRQRNQQAREQSTSYSGSSSSSSSTGTGVSPAYDLLDAWAASHYAAFWYAARRYGEVGALSASHWSTKIARRLNWIGKGFLGVTGYVAGTEQWMRDQSRADLTVGQKLFRSGVVGVSSMTGSLAGAGAGLLFCNGGAFVCSPVLATGAANGAEEAASYSLTLLDRSGIATPDPANGPLTVAPLLGTLRELLQN